MWASSIAVRLFPTPVGPERMTMFAVLEYNFNHQKESQQRYQQQHAQYLLPA